MSSIKRLRSTLLGLAAGASVLLSGGPVLAQSSIGGSCDGCDWKIYPGMVCKQGGSQQGLDYWFGRARNLSSSRKVVDCGLVRDHNRPQRVYVNTIDQHWSENVTCSLYAMLNDSSWPSYYFAYGYRGYNDIGTEGRSSSIQRLSMAPPYAAKDHNTSYLVGCRLPPIDRGAASEIISLEVGEL